MDKMVKMDTCGKNCLQSMKFLLRTNSSGIFSGTSDLHTQQDVDTGNDGSFVTLASLGIWLHVLLPIFVGQVR